MGSTLSVFKTLTIPAVISLLIFLLSSYVLLPLWRQYRSRYSHYLPLETISDRTSSYRSRLQHTIARWLVPSQWRTGLRDRLVVADAASDDGFSSDEGEELDAVSDDRRRALSLTLRDGPMDNTRRLSRDLEEGFMDDSDDEHDGGSRRR